MTDEELQAIRARVEAATPGPWTKDQDSPIVRGPEMILYDEGGHDHPDAEFIAHARTDVPALLAEVDRLKAEHAEHLARHAHMARLIEWVRQLMVGQRVPEAAFEWEIVRLVDERLRALTREPPAPPQAVASAGSCRTCGIALPAMVSVDDPFCSDRCRDRWAATMP